VRSSLGNVDEEKGHRWSLVMHNDVVDTSVFTRAHGTFGSRVRAADRSLLDLDSERRRLFAAGRREPFANFFFGGFGNNYVDHQAEQRFREYYALPGWSSMRWAVRNFAKSTVEWSLPPVHFARAGTPGFYLTWMRPSVFASGLVTNSTASGYSPYGRRHRWPAGFPLEHVVDARSRHCRSAARWRSRTVSLRVVKP
jgi:hypothetical protein